ncbi:MAG: hypothetical protein ACFB16_20340 [Phormidesmis sp.]
MELFAAGLSWRSPDVHQWMGEVGTPSRHYLDVDGIYFLLERLAIYICDGAPHDKEAVVQNNSGLRAAEHSQRCAVKTEAAW